MAIAAVVFSVIGYFALGMPGMDHGSGMGSMEMPGDQRPMPARLTPAEFEQAMEREDTFVIDVHVPDGARIEGTDMAIPYDMIGAPDAVPSDPGTPILLYCRTGAMSASAARALLEAGFTDVSILDGGTDAWVASGRTVNGV